MEYKYKTNNESKASRHLGEHVRKNIMPVGLSVTEAAKQLGIGRVALSNFLNGKSGLSSNLASRLQRSFGVNADDLMRMQATQKIESVKNKKKLASIQPYAPSVDLIKASEIDDWADEHTARSELPALLRKLVHSTHQGILHIDFPAYENAERPGWDGRLETKYQTPWIPKGKSGWEFGCGTSPKSKAEQDYVKRTRKISGEEREKTTFVFVTPRNWRDKDKWVRTKRSKREWKDVRAYDASDLEQWLETSTVATHWLANKLGKPMQGYRLLSYYWDMWKSACEPELTKAMFMPNVEGQGKKFIQWLEEKPSNLFTIYADTHEEGLAFLHCMIEEVEECEYRGRALVFDSLDALDRMLKNASNKSFMVVTTESKIQQHLFSYSKRFHCVNMQLRGQWHKRKDEDEACIRLDLPKARDFESALKDMGYTDSSEIDLYRRKTGCSPSILRRLLPQKNFVPAPDWSEGPMAPHMLPFVLAGKWEEDCDGDKEIISEIAGVKAFNELENRLAKIKGLQESPIRSIDRLTYVTSKMEVLYSVGYYATKENLEAFFSVVEKVLLGSRDGIPSGMDKKLSKDRDSAQYHKHSIQLRNGICDSLVFLAVHGTNLFENDYQKQSLIKHKTYHLVNKYLEDFEFGKQSSFHLDHLPELAEAAPKIFIDLIEEKLDNYESLLTKKNATATPALIPWSLPLALECLAWNKEEFYRATLILSSLSSERFQADGNMKSPFSSLVGLFCPFAPQTSTTAEDRIEALKKIVDSHPSLGWKLCQRILTMNFLASSYRPLWRDDAIGLDKQSENLYKLKCSTIEICLGWKRHDENTIGDLVDLLPYLDKDESIKGRIWGLIEEWCRAKHSDDRRMKVLDRIRNYWIRHSHQNMTELDKQYFTSAYELLESYVLIHRHKWLFTTSGESLLPSEINDKDFMPVKEVVLDRTTALKEIWNKRKFTGIRGLLAEVNNGARGIGVAMLDVLEYKSSRIIQFIERCLSEKNRELDPVMSECVKGLLIKVDGELWRELVEKAEIALKEERQFEKFIACLPINHETLDIIRKQAGGEYWATVNPSHIGKLSIPDIELVVEGFLDADRASLAFYAVDISLGWNKLPDRLLLGLLKAVADNLKELPMQMINNNIDVALKSLDRRDSIETLEKAKLEFKCLLADFRVCYPNIEQLLIESPEMYAWAICAAKGSEPLLEVPIEFQFIKNNSGLPSNFSFVIAEILSQMYPPGTGSGDNIDSSFLSGWISKVRSLCKEHDCLQKCDEFIGKLLSNQKVKKGEDWPHPEICEIIEALDSKVINDNFVYGVYFAYDQVVIDDQQYREEADKYRAYARNKPLHMRGLLLNVVSIFEERADMIESMSSQEEQLSRIS